MKKPTLRNLKKKADSIFSIYIRKRGADFDGYASCFTCGIKKRWQELQLGHYESRSHNATRFDEDNARIQCVSCNVFKHGNLPQFALKLIKEGVDLKALHKKALKVHQFTIKELQEIIKKYERN